MSAAFRAPIGKAGSGPAGIPAIGEFGCGRIPTGGPVRLEHFLVGFPTLRLEGQTLPQIYRN